MSFQKVQQNEKQFNLCRNHSGTRVNILHLTEQEFIKMSFQGRECCFLFKKMFGFAIVAAVVLCCSCCHSCCCCCLRSCFLPFLGCPLDGFEDACEELVGEFWEHYATNQHSEHGWSRHVVHISCNGRQHGETRAYKSSQHSDHGKQQ